MRPVCSDARQPTFLIAGAGALGSAFGAMLRVAGFEVALFGRNRAHMDAIRASGLRITGLWGDRTARGFRVVADPEQIPDPDYVLVTVKSFDTRKLLETIAPRCERAQYVTLQNGVGNIEAVTEVVGRERTIGGMVIIGFTVPTPGEVAVTVYGGDVQMGRPSAAPGEAPDAEVSRLVEALNASGIITHATDNIRGAIWGKVLYNCALNALGAVLGVPYGELSSPHTWAIIERLVRETYAVAAAEGVRLPWSDATEYLRVLAERQLPATAKHRASMLQDIERRRRTEIEHLNGAIARMGASYGIAVPVNATLAALVRHFEAHGPGEEKA
jgi:2-dehydropantoate 2-reductase